LNQIVEAHNDRRREQGKPALAPLSTERLLATILTVFESMHNRFCISGFKAFEPLYYKRWLHTDQIVTLEMEGNARARILGITSDYGLLKAEELGWDDHGTGKIFALQTDNNSFDFFRGLLKRKA
jgi:biotin--protein ligase